MMAAIRDAMWEAAIGALAIGPVALSALLLLDWWSQPGMTLPIMLGSALGFLWGSAAWLLLAWKLAR